MCHHLHVSPINIIFSIIINYIAQQVDQVLRSLSHEQWRNNLMTEGSHGSPKVFNFIFYMHLIILYIIFIYILIILYKILKVFNYILYYIYIYILSFKKYLSFLFLYIIYYVFLLFKK